MSLVMYAPKFDCVNPLFANGHFWATSSTPLSANGPLLGHLFGFKYFDKITLMYMIKIL